MDILKNRINIFSVETSFCQFSNMDSSGLKKMFILQYYIHKNVYQKMFSKITFFFFIMADVMPYVRLMLCLGWCYCLFSFGRFCNIWADVITHVIYLADVIAFINVIVVDKTLHHLCNLLMAGVIAKWQDGTATLLYLELADVIAMWQDVKATFILYMADVIARWQML